MEEPDAITTPSPTQNVVKRDSYVDTSIADATVPDAMAADAPVATMSLDTETGTPADTPADTPLSTQPSKCSPPKAKASRIVPPIVGMPPADEGDDSLALLSARSAAGRMDQLAQFAEALPIANRNKEDVEKRQDFFNVLRGKNMKLSFVRLEEIKAQQMVDLPSLVLRKSFLFAKAATPKKGSPPFVATHGPSPRVPGADDLSFVEFRYMLMYIQEFIRVQVLLDVTDVTQCVELAEIKQKLCDRNYADAVAFMDSHSEATEVLPFEKVAQYAIKVKLDARLGKIVRPGVTSLDGGAIVRPGVTSLDGGADSVKPSGAPSSPVARRSPKLGSTTKSSLSITMATATSLRPGTRLGPTTSTSKAKPVKPIGGVLAKTAASAARPPAKMAAAAARPLVAATAKAKAIPPKVAPPSKTVVKAKMPGSATGGVPKAKVKPVSTAPVPKVKASFKVSGAKAPLVKAKSTIGTFAPSARSPEQALWEKLVKLPKGLEAQKRLFDKFDPNSNGVLTFADFQEGMTQVLPRELDTRVTMRAYQTAKDRSPDTDHDVSLTEFPILLVYLRDYAELRVMFKRVETNKDDRVTSEQFIRAQQKLATWGAKNHDPAKAFTSIDAQGEGTILFDEFCDWAIKQKLDFPEDNNPSARITATSGVMLNTISRQGIPAKATQQLFQGSAAKLSQDSAVKLSQGSAAKLSQGSAAKVSQDSAAKLSQGSAAKLSQGSAAKLSQGSATKVSKGLAAKLSQGSAAKLSQGSAAKVSKGLAAKLSQGSATKLSQSSAVKVSKVSAAKLSQGSASKHSQGPAENSLRSGGVVADQRPTRPSISSFMWQELATKFPTEKSEDDLQRRKDLFKQVDPNGNGYASVTDIDRCLKSAVAGDTLFNGQQVTLRAFQAAIDRKGHPSPAEKRDVQWGDFHVLLLYLRDYCELHAMFQARAMVHDGRISLNALVDATPELAAWGAQIDNPEETFAQICLDGDRAVLFDKFCDWAIKQKLLHNDDGGVDVEGGDTQKLLHNDDGGVDVEGGDAPAELGTAVLEKSSPESPGGRSPKKNGEVSCESMKNNDNSRIAPHIWKELAAKLPTAPSEEDEARRKELFDQIDPNDNGFVYRADIAGELQTALNNDVFLRNKEVTMRACQAIKALDVSSDNDYIAYRELCPLLHYIRTFAELHVLYEGLDASNDGRIGYDEFVDASAVLAEWGADIDGDAVLQAFQEMDSNAVGTVPFGEFCHWAAARKMSLRFPQANGAPMPAGENACGLDEESANAHVTTDKAGASDELADGLAPKGSGSALGVGDEASTRTSGMTGEQSAQSRASGGSSKQRKRKKNKKQSLKEHDTSLLQS